MDQNKSANILNIFKKNNSLKNISQCLENKLKNRLKIQQKVNIQKYLSNISIKPNYNPIQIKLLGGSDQPLQFGDSQIQCILNQNEDRNSITIDQFLIESIQQNISLINLKRPQSDKQEEKSQQNKNQQFNENENQNQNQNQFKDTIAKKDNIRKRVTIDREQVNEYEIGIIESSQNENQQFNQNKYQNQNKLKEQTIKAYNRKQQILESDLSFIMEVTMVLGQANEYEIDNNESIQNENQILSISNVDKSKQKLKEEEYKFLSSIFKLGDYKISGGEADIFFNIKEKVAFRHSNQMSVQKLNLMVSKSQELVFGDYIDNSKHENK
ncbi:hypothetical protein ABPG73_017082 [Tetrahymena malaccensis]